MPCPAATLDRDTAGRRDLGDPPLDVQAGAQQCTCGVGIGRIELVERQRPIAGDDRCSHRLTLRTHVEPGTPPDSSQSLTRPDGSVWGSLQANTALPARQRGDRLLQVSMMLRRDRGADARRPGRGRRPACPGARACSAARSVSGICAIGRTRLGEVPGRLQHPQQPLGPGRRQQRQVKPPALPVVAAVVGARCAVHRAS